MIKVGNVAMVSLCDITFDDRARQNLGDLSGIEESMKESGLISPLAVMEVDDKYRLLAGERRYWVLRKNEVDKIPVRIFPADITELEMKSIELAENFHRKDFEYWEEDALVKEIHALQQQVHGIKPPGPGVKGWGTADTGELMGTTKASVSTAIKRAEAREAFPELFEKCKSQQDASKVVKKMNEALIKDTLARRLESKGTMPAAMKLSSSFVLKDFFVGVKEIPEGIMHLVEIDPPYGIKLGDAKKRDGESIYNQEDYNEVDAETYQIFLARTFKECYRVMAEHSWLLCWFAPEPWFEMVFRELVNAGFNSTRMCGIWTKPSGQSKRPEMHLANAYEMFFYAWKGRPAINKAGRSNIFSFPPVLPQQKTHPTERPIELMKEIYETFAFPGSRVLIPFLGSGSGLIAASQLGMSPIGFELGKGYRDSFLVKLHSMSVR
jgi:DNA modification methylase